MEEKVSLLRERVDRRSNAADDDDDDVEGSHATSAAATRTTRGGGGGKDNNANPFLFLGDRRGGGRCLRRIIHNCLFAKSSSSSKPRPRSSRWLFLRQGVDAASTTTTWRRCLVVSLLASLALAFVCHFVVVPLVCADPNYFSQRTQPPLPPHPKRASATLFSESNACYDMALYVLLKSWEASHSAYPMLVLHSIPLPPSVEALCKSTENNNIRAVLVPEISSHVVQEKRWRKSATKLNVWNQTEFDQLAYYDSDHVFVENGDDIFDELLVTTTTTTGGDSTNDNKNKNKNKNNEEEDHNDDSNTNTNNNYYVFGNPDEGYPWMFNSGTMLIRPSTDTYRKLVQLYNQRLLVLNSREMKKSGDQRFLNAIFNRNNRWHAFARPTWKKVAHTKLWKAATRPEPVYARYKDIAQRWVTELKLEKEVQECLSSSSSGLPVKNN